MLLINKSNNKLSDCYFPFNNKIKCNDNQSKRIKQGTSSVERNKPLRCYTRPAKGHTPTELRKTKRVCDVYLNILERYKDCDRGWVNAQFKWAYMSCYESQDLEKDILKKIEKRKRNEYSILRRILEGDEISYKLMCSTCSSSVVDYSTCG